jgi:hypothetical protein
VGEQGSCCRRVLAKPIRAAQATVHHSFTFSRSTSAIGDWAGSISSQSTRHLEPTYS